MKTAIILIVSAIVLFFSFRLFTRAAGSLSPTKLNTVSYVFYIQIVLLAFIGSILVATGRADYHRLIAPVSEQTKFWAWVGVLYSMVAMPVAMILLNRVFNVRPAQQFHSYIHQPIAIRQGPVLTTAILCIFCSIAVFVLAYMIVNVDNIPVITALQGDKEAAAIQRVDVRRNFGGLQYVVNLLGYLMMPVFTYYATMIAINMKRTRYWVMLIILFVCTSFLLVFDTQKAPIALFLLGFIILTTLMRGGISWRSLLLFSCLALLLIAGGYALTTDKNVVKLLTDPRSALWTRVFITELAGYVLSLEYFPDVITTPTWQIGLPSFILDQLGLSNVESARLLMMHVNPEGIASGEANLISSYYLGEAWANYGWAGLLIAPFVVGVVIQSVHIFLLKNPKDPLIIAFYSYMTVRWLLNSGFVNFLYLKIILYPFILYIIFKFIIKLLANKIARIDPNNINMSTLFRVSPALVTRCIEWLLIATSFSFPFGRKYTSLLMILLFIGLAIQMIQNRRVLQDNLLDRQGLVLLCLPVAYYILCIVGLAYTSNLQAGIFELDKKISLLIFPLFFLVFGRNLDVTKIEAILKSFLAGILACGLISIGLGFYRSVHYVDGAFVFRTAVNDSAYEQEYPFFEQATQGGNYFFGNYISPFLHTNYYGYYLAFGSIIAFYFFAFKRRNIGYFVASIFLACVLVLCDARGPIIAFLASTLIVAVFAARTRIVRWMLPVLMAAVVAIILVSPRTSLLISNLKDTFSNVDYHSTESAVLRLVVWDAAMEVISENWLLGVGTGDREDAIVAVTKNKNKMAYEMKLNAHNQYLEVFLTFGVFGFLVLAALSILPLIRALTRHHLLFASFMLITCMNMMFESLLQVFQGIAFFSFFYSLFIFHSYHKSIAEGKYESVASS